MAEQIPYGVVVNIIDKLGSLAFREIGRIYGVMEELDKLQTTIKLIQAALSDAEKRQQDDGDALVKAWINSLREVVNDADNLFDDFLIERTRRKVKSHGQVRVFLSSKNQLLFRWKMARKVQDIRQKFDDLSGDISKLNLVVSSGHIHNNLSERTWRDTDSFVLESDIVGREENKKEIIDLLKQPNTNIAIVGFGGLGKTALAQMIYNDAAVKGLFKKIMWVCVSEDFDVKSILKKMLKSLEVKEAVDGFELDQLQKKLHEELNGQKYMLVLDDIWNENSLKWDELKKYLMCGCEGSKILVTTRSEKVAKIMGIDKPYVLGGLTEEESWILLKKVAFGDDVSRECQNVESIGKRIAEKCAGVPLAIKTVGGLLRSNHEEVEWRRILDGDFWRLCEGKERSIMPVLKLSYQNLPPELRQCFVYCCLYPKDSIIYSDELIQLWMAQGYLESSYESDRLEDVGNQYIKYLLMRSFFQEARLNEDGDIESFKMHDLMHDLAKLVGGNDCCYLENGEEAIVGRPMHMALADSISCSLSSVDTSHLRTLVFPYMEDQLLANPSLIKSLKYLRALNLSNSSITQLPEFIDKLKHLKYLDLSFCWDLTSIPASIGNLVSLQTLKLNDCNELVFPTKVITRLINLRRFEFDYCKAFEDKMPLGLGKLTSLQHISHFVVAEESAKCKSGTLNELKDLNQIRDKLTICNLGSVKEVQLESQEANLRAKQHIQNLELFWGIDEFSNMIKNKNSDSLELLNNLCPPQNLKRLAVHRYPGMRFSCWVSSLSNVVKISLSKFSKCEDLPPLERLRCLQTLELKGMDELKWIYYEENSTKFFPSLKTLSFYQCPKLRGWQRWGDDNKQSDTGDHLSLPLSFSCISDLKIIYCPNMTCMPTFPHLDKSLRLIDCSVKPLKDTCLVWAEPSTLYPLSDLRYLLIDDVRDIESMSEEWMRNLKSLEDLSIFGSSVILAMSRQLQHLASQLQSLKISLVDRLDVLWKDDEDGECMRCQASFYCLRTLQTISFEYCRDMKALPEQIGKLQSLKHIRIIGCEELESLPEAMRHLSNLQTLEIRQCPMLRKRCKAETGEDWPKIAHIPNIHIFY